MRPQITIPARASTHVHAVLQVDLNAEGPCESGAKFFAVSNRPGSATPWRVEASDPAHAEKPLAAGSAVRISAQTAAGCRLYVTAPAPPCASACTSASAAALSCDGEPTLEKELPGPAMSQVWTLELESALPSAGFNLVSQVCYSSSRLQEPQHTALVQHHARFSPDLCLPHYRARPASADLALAPVPPTAYLTWTSFQSSSPAFRWPLGPAAQPSLSRHG